MSANEKVRTLSAVMGAPIKIPNPKFSVGGVQTSETEFTQ